MYKSCLALLLALFPISLWSAPSISSGLGTKGDGNSYTITGSGFGSQKSCPTNCKPMVYADFSASNSSPNSTLGLASAWDALTKLSTSTTDSVGGSYALQSDSDWEGTLTAVRYDEVHNSGEKFYLSVHRKATHNEDNNWKFWRIWSPNDGDNYPNWIAANNNSPNFQFSYVEVCDVDQYRATHSNYFVPDGSDVWIFEELRYQYHTSTSAFDGSYEIRQNFSVAGSSDSYSFNCGTQSGDLQEINIENDPSNFTPADSEVFYDEIYMDNSWARIYLSTHSTFAAIASRSAMVQPYSAWSDTSITFTQKYGYFTDSDTVYLYICDNSNSCSANGFELVTQAAASEERMTTTGGATITGGMTLQ